MGSDPIVSNSSCLIGLEAIGHIFLLESLYGTVLIPDAVAREWGQALPSWITVQSAQNVPLVKSLLVDLGAGEAEAIALALDVGAARLILDDKKARRFANSLGVPVIGTVGITLVAKQRGFISQVRPLLENLQAAGFHISDSLYLQALQLASE